MISSVTRFACLAVCLNMMACTEVREISASTDDDKDVTTFQDGADGPQDDATSTNDTESMDGEELDASPPIELPESIEELQIALEFDVQSLSGLVSVTPIVARAEGVYLESSFSLMVFD